MKSLVESIQESILNVTDNQLDNDSKWLQLKEVKALEGLVEYLEQSKLDWEIDNSRSGWGNDAGKCVVVHISKRVDCVLDFLYKGCTEVIYSLVDSSTGEELDTTASTNNSDRLKWGEYLDFKSDFRKRITKLKNKVKKLGRWDDYERTRLNAKIAKYENILKLL